MVSFETSFFVGALLAFVIGTCFAKACQSFVASRLGDRLPRSEGRMSFNPGRHMDPLGLLLALFLALGISTVAWGKPLNLNPFANKLGRFGVAVIGLVGPLAYLFLALVSGLVFRLLLNVAPAGVSSGNTGFLAGGRDFLSGVALAFTIYNVLLAAFNLLPLPPLDGYNIFFKGLLPAQWDMKLIWLETYGMVLLLVLVLILPFFIGINPLFQFFFNPLARLFLSLLGLA